MGLYSGGLIIRRIFASEIWGAYFFLGGGGGGGWGLIIGILRYTPFTSPSRPQLGTIHGPREKLLPKSLAFSL